MKALKKVLFDAYRHVEYMGFWKTYTMKTRKCEDEWREADALQEEIEPIGIDAEYEDDDENDEDDYRELPTGDGTGTHVEAVYDDDDHEIFRGWRPIPMLRPTNENFATIYEPPETGAEAGAEEDNTSDEY